jgi:hypothetical protein
VLHLLRLFFPNSDPLVGTLEAFGRSPGADREVTRCHDDRVMDAVSKRGAAASFDHLVGAGEQRRRHVEAERLRRDQIQDEIEFGRLLDRRARLRPKFRCPSYLSALNSFKRERATFFTDSTANGRIL